MMKPTWLNLLKNVSTIVLVFIAAMFFGGYLQRDLTSLLILGIIFTVGAFALNKFLSFKIKKELIRRDERIRIEEREKNSK